MGVIRSNRQCVQSSKKKTLYFQFKGVEACKVNIQDVGSYKRVIQFNARNHYTLQHPSTNYLSLARPFPTLTNNSSPHCGRLKFTQFSFCTLKLSLYRLVSRLLISQTPPPPPIALVLKEYGQLSYDYPVSETMTRVNGKTKKKLLSSIFQILLEMAASLHLL